MRVGTGRMDFLRGRLLRRSPATWSKEGDGGRGSFSATESSSRRGSSTSSWLRERTSGTSWGKEGTSVSSWREGSSVCPPYTSKSSYSKSEQSWRLPRLRINRFNQNRKNYSVKGPHSHHGDHQQLPQGRRRLQGDLWTNPKFQCWEIQFSISTS